MESKWERLEEGIVLEQLNGNTKGTMTSLACEQTIVEKTVYGTNVRGMKWDVSHLMKRCVSNYYIISTPIRRKDGTKC